MKKQMVTFAAGLLAASSASAQQAPLALSSSDVALQACQAVQVATIAIAQDFPGTTVKNCTGYTGTGKDRVQTDFNQAAVIETDITPSAALKANPAWAEVVDNNCNTAKMVVAYGGSDKMKTVFDAAGTDIAQMTALGEQSAALIKNSPVQCVKGSRDGQMTWRISIPVTR